MRRRNQALPMIHQGAGLDDCGIIRVLVWFAFCCSSKDLTVMSHHTTCYWKKHSVACFACALHLAVTKRKNREKIQPFCFHTLHNDLEFWVPKSPFWPTDKQTKQTVFKQITCIQKWIWSETSDLGWHVFLPRNCEMKKRYIANLLCFVLRLCRHNYRPQEVTDLFYPIAGQFSFPIAIS